MNTNDKFLCVPITIGFASPLRLCVKTITLLSPHLSWISPASGPLPAGREPPLSISRMRLEWARTQGSSEKFGAFVTFWNVSFLVHPSGPDSASCLSVFDCYNDTAESIPSQKLLAFAAGVSFFLSESHSYCFSAPPPAGCTGILQSASFQLQPPFAPGQAIRRNIAFFRVHPSMKCFVAFETCFVSLCYNDTLC